MALTPSPPPHASATATGLLTYLAQVIGGVKTFAAKVIAQAGIEIYAAVGSAVPLYVRGASAQSVPFLQVDNSTGAQLLTLDSAGVLNVKAAGLTVSGYANSLITSTGSVVDLGNSGAIPARATYLIASTSAASTGFYASNSAAFGAPGTFKAWSETLGAVSTDVIAKVGAYIADGSVHASAKLLSLRTGLGGTEVEKAYFEKNGSLVAPYLYVPNASAGGVFWGLCRITGQNVNGALDLSYNGQTPAIGLNTATGRIDQFGTDDTANAGNRTVNKPTGINTLASGATTITVTNNLCTATSRVLVTFHADPGGRYWVTKAAGSFTVNVSAAPGADAPFSWEVSSMK